MRCQIDKGEELIFFCKYSAGHSHNSFGHRGGVEHEIKAYQELLEVLPLTKPYLLGTYTDHSADEVWIILEYLEGSEYLYRTSGSTAMVCAACWIGEFHSINTQHLQNKKLSFLRQYDSEYYEGWLDRTLEFAGSLVQKYPWLSILYEGFGGVMATLLSAQQTVIHGEYYAQNILFREGNIYPVDWESTAIAGGEIDLASLTERWPEEISNSCEIAYRDTRWPDGPPDNFNQILDSARLYLNLRWLGDRREWTTSEEHSWRFELMHEIGQRLNLF